MSRRNSGYFVSHPVNNIVPAYLPQVGWVTHMGDGLFTHGTRYTLTKVGDEVVDDNSSQSSQS